MNSGFRVGVDVFGHITSFHRDREEGIELAESPDPAQAVTREEAAKNFTGLLEMELQYLERLPSYGPFKPEGEARPALVYVPAGLTAAIDALTGKPLAEFMPSLPRSQRLTLQGEGRQLIVKTPEEAGKLLTDVFGIDLAGMQFHGSVDVSPFGNRESKQKDYSWNTMPQKGGDGRPDPGQMRHAHMTIDAGTGQVIGFNYQDESGRGQKGTASLEAAQETAVQLLQKYLPEGPVEMEMRVRYQDVEEMIPAWVDKSKLKEHERPRPVISFTFNRVHQGVPVMDRAYSAQVDALTGKIVGFYTGKSVSSITKPDVALPDNRNVVSPEAAKAEFLQQHPLKLVYIWPEYFNQKAPAPWLVYILGPGAGYFVDAFTGKTVTTRNE